MIKFAKNNFKLKRIIFEKGSWRKLSGVEIDICPRLTVIAGHNGIGKSSILGFIANASGMAARELREVKTYFGKDFISKFEEQFRLSPSDVSTNNSEKGKIRLLYRVKGEILEKICNIGKTKKKSGEIRYRVVPRNKDKGENIFGVREAGKVPLPTIFVSSSRTLPIGECPTVNKKEVGLDAEDAAFLKEFCNKIIPGEAVNNGGQELDLSLDRGYVLRSLHPQYLYDVTTISLGQGAVAAIGTALASFARLKRCLGKEYVGGMLVIDEIEAGLHPKAQIELAKSLMQYAKKFNLQIVVTTHSLVFIEQIYTVSFKKESVDGVVYLMDTKSPRVAHLNFEEMREEMCLSKTAWTKRKPPEMTVYTEDMEGLFFLKTILKFRGGIEREKSLKMKINKAAMKIGCRQLLLMAKNPRLKQFNKCSLLVLDGDVDAKELEGLSNVLKLRTEAGQLRSPEKELEFFLNKARNNVNGPEHAALLKQNVSWDYVEKITSDIENKKKLSNAVDADREIYKKWFNAISARKRTDMIMAWCEAHQEDVDGFVNLYLRKLSSVRCGLVG